METAMVLPSHTTAACDKLDLSYWLRLPRQYLEINNPGLQTSQAYNVPVASIGD
jgi:hypothetical protein